MTFARPFSIDQAGRDIWQFRLAHPDELIYQGRALCRRPLQTSGRALFRRKGDDLAWQDTQNAVLFKLVPGPFHIYILYGCKLIADRIKHRGTRLAVFAAHHVIRTFQVSTSQAFHTTQRLSITLPNQPAFRRRRGSETTSYFDRADSHASEGVFHCKVFSKSGSFCLVPFGGNLERFGFIGQCPPGQNSALVEAER